MKRNSIFTKFSIIVLLFLCIYASAVSTRVIEQIRDKQVLTASDLEAIDNFIKMAIDELINSQDFTEVARLRAQITSMQSSQSQYRQQYSKSCKQHLSEAMRTTQEKEGDLRHEVRVNLMILVSELNDPELIDLALAALEDEDKAVQYWAVRAVTKEQLISHLKEITADSIIDRIAGELQKSAARIGSKAACLMVNFAVIANSEATEELVFKLTDMRIADYEKYQAKPGVIDMKMLKLLCNKILTKQQQVSKYGSRFCQLYSYIFQRYIYHLKDQVSESGRDTHMLASILVEIEDKCIGRLTGLKQGVIRDSIKKSSYGALELEHSRLLGDDSRNGEIPSKSNFDYGKNEDGSIRIRPKVLPKSKPDTM